MHRVRDGVKVRSKANIVVSSVEQDDDDVSPEDLEELLKNVPGDASDDDESLDAELEELLKDPIGDIVPSSSTSSKSLSKKDASSKAHATSHDCGLHVDTKGVRDETVKQIHDVLSEHCETKAQIEVLEKKIDQASAISSKIEAQKSELEKLSKEVSVLELKARTMVIDDKIAQQNANLKHLNELKTNLQMKIQDVDKVALGINGKIAALEATKSHANKTSTFENTGETDSTDVGSDEEDVKSAADIVKMLKKVLDGAVSSHSASNDKTLEHISSVLKKLDTAGEKSKAPAAPHPAAPAAPHPATPATPHPAAPATPHPATPATPHPATTPSTTPSTASAF